MGLLRSVGRILCLARDGAPLRRMPQHWNWDPVCALAALTHTELASH